MRSATRLPLAPNQRCERMVTNHVADKNWEFNGCTDQGAGIRAHRQEPQ